MTLVDEENHRRPHDSKGLEQQPVVVDTRFSCNICFESVVEPVVTQCGHLYCWPCLYKWLEPGLTLQERSSLGILSAGAGIHNNNTTSSRRVCPVCKSSTSLQSLVPIYVRSSDQDEADEPQQQEPPNPGVTSPCSTAGTEVTDNRTSAHDDDSEHTVEDELDHTLSTGLRQRRTSRSTAANENGETTTLTPRGSVPSRPAASTPQQPLSPAETPNNIMQQPSPFRQRRGSGGDHGGNGVWLSPLRPTAHGASLSHGLMLSLFPQNQPQHRGGIPPLHHRMDQPNNNNNNIPEGEIAPGATEYLSRLLIMLASFVLLCLLML